MSYVHACAAAPAATLPSDVVGNFLREADLLVEPIRIEDGYAVVPDKAGLGIELDEEAVRRYQVRDRPGGAADRQPRLTGSGWALPFCPGRRQSTYTAVRLQENRDLAPLLLKA